VKYSANEWPAKLPTQENGNDTRNLPILSKDIEQFVQIVNTIPYDIRSTDNNFARYNQNFEAEKKRPDHELRSREQIHKIETHVTNDNTDLFCGVFRDLISYGIVFTICTDCSMSLLRMGRLRVSFPFSCVGSLAGHSLAEYFTESLYDS
jgi:hypothetical protein